ncbi:MAG: UDP-N-acetylmuramate dehydrogenase [Chloroflexi bacterium]|nr:UDP-N-acetylmuramate dehydrogenase [Chloroflexota bacterium]
MKLPAALQSRLLPDQSLARFTAARLGGNADWLFIAKELDDLVDVVSAAWNEGLPVRVLGGGANVLVSDKGVRGLVVINNVSTIEFGNWHDDDGCKRNVSATSGVGLTVLARKCAAHGLSGMEWAVSVPGTIGGAVVNNAGAHGGDMATSICDIVVLDAQKGPQILSKTELEYGYRTSTLKARTDRRFLVLMATLALHPAPNAEIEARMNEFIAYRKKTQPPGASLGSIFKNPPGDFAGRLIESCGLKGHTIGAVQVSPLHANWFINSGAASASDYAALVRYVQARVLEHTGVALETEIELIGDWD